MNYCRPARHQARFETFLSVRNCDFSIRERHSRGQFLTFTADELKALDVESTKIVDLEKFVPDRKSVV